MVQSFPADGVQFGRARIDPQAQPQVPLTLGPGQPDDLVIGLPNRSAEKRCKELPPIGFRIKQIGQKRRFIQSQLPAEEEAAVAEQGLDGIVILGWVVGSNADEEVCVGLGHYFFLLSSIHLGRPLYFTLPYHIWPPITCAQTEASLNFR